MIVLMVCGHVGGDAIVRVLDSGHKVITFSVAHTEKWKDKQSGEDKQRTVWVNCSWWKTAEQSTEVARFIKKGGIVTVTGDAGAKWWQSSADHSIHAVIECKVSQLQLGGSVVAGTGGQAQSTIAEPTPIPSSDQNSSPLDDLPF